MQIDAKVFTQQEKSPKKNKNLPKNAFSQKRPGKLNFWNQFLNPHIKPVLSVYLNVSGIGISFFTLSAFLHTVHGFKHFHGVGQGDLFFFAGRPSLLRMLKKLHFTHQQENAKLFLAKYIW